MHPKYYILQRDFGRLFGVTGQAVCLQAQRAGIESFKIGNSSAFSSSSARHLMKLRGFNYQQSVIAFQMLKGGSTKTSSAFNLGIRLNQCGAKVLFIDTDGQGNLTSALGHEVTNSTPVLYHIIDGSAEVSDALVSISDSLDLLPSDFDNSGLDLLISSKRMNIQTVIADIIEPLRKKYDFIIFDCNPALSALNTAIALACDKVIIPVNPDDFSRRGLDKVLDEFQRVQKQYRTQINYQLLFTLHDARETSSRKYLLEYLSKHPDRIFSSVIRRNADVKNAIDQKKSIFEMKGAGAREDFESLACEVLGLPAVSEVSGNA